MNVIKRFDGFEVSLLEVLEGIIMPTNLNKKMLTVKLRVTGFFLIPDELNIGNVDISLWDDPL